jgi:hypothetical protein
VRTTGSPLGGPPVRPAAGTSGACWVTLGSNHAAALAAGLGVVALALHRAICVSQAKIKAWNTKAQRDLLQPNFVQSSSKGVSSAVDNPCEILPKSSTPSKTR